jgi:O-antigen/teichoic acid export membrane protein
MRPDMSHLLASYRSGDDDPRWLLLGAAIFLFFGLFSIYAGGTFTPAKFTRSRPVDRDKEPKLYWLLVTLYCGIGFGFLAGYLYSYLK